MSALRTKPDAALNRQALAQIQAILGAVATVRLGKVEWEVPSGPGFIDAVLPVSIPGGHLKLTIEARARVTPQTAIAICRRLRSGAGDRLPVLYAPVVSERVAEIASQEGVGYADGAGNCRIWSDKHPFLIERSGRRAEGDRPRGAVNPFSPKSSRIARAMLGQPSKGWKIRELQGHSDVALSLGLVSRVGRALQEGGYAVERHGLLYLRDAAGLLRAWEKAYRGPAEKIDLYYRGTMAEAEASVSRWCRENGYRCALAGFSAAWRLAPEVRYAIAAVYVDDGCFDLPELHRLGEETGGVPVDTGATLTLWRPYDESVFAGNPEANPERPPITSPIQTDLDLTFKGGRGEEAVVAIHRKYFAEEFDGVAQRAERWKHEFI